ncbi:vasoactive intestinal polypeptide receptor 2-like isoform X2 [Anoplophora glabripennis]|nr:vasoactive intestinal polypeptide receptor 2-like isoform X2 [Anoplophora glabripennis]XP_018572136.1 vasoactive intestinal polypeptide receptor 2-like isoform X2 [Anoplophora glabripennis]
MPNNHVQEAIDTQTRLQKAAEESCIRAYGYNVTIKNQNPFYNETSQSFMCSPFWDTILCWPYTPADTLAEMGCPSLVTGFRTTEIATRKCTENGTWFISDSTHEPWANYTACMNGTSTTTIFMNNLRKSEISQNSAAIFPALKIISQTGYAVSLISLIIAFCIMFLIKKLHCARNILHMNLFASFILRAFFYILKDVLFIGGVGFWNDFIIKNGELYFKTDVETNNYECKLLSSLVQYFTTANYSWILMEGLYLNNLIFRALFADSSKNLVHYIIFGWGLPLLVIIPWVVARLLIEDTLCWTTNDNLLVYMIIAIPTIISVLINLVLFVIISIVLYTKLRSPINEDSRRYQKWAKSTLVLVPLFGVHYAVFLVFFFIGQTDLWLVCDTLFGSFQGFFVAVLYCFLNGEVKTELKPHIYSVLTYLATHKCFSTCFPCREKYLRSAVGRQSVCTTMSCSSLYANGVVHRNSKSKWEMFPKSKHSNAPDKGKEHVCCNGTRTSRSHSKSSQNGLHFLNCNNKHIQPMQSVPNLSVETTLCMDQEQEKRHSEHLTIEEEISMLDGHC